MNSAQPIASNEAGPPGAIRVPITCSRCQKTGTVPFHPTPGRPVYCRECFQKTPRPLGPRGPRYTNVQPRQRMLAQGRKGHFVHDALAVLERADHMDETQRRGFVEMVFTRGARQSTDAATQFVDEKHADDTITDVEADRLVGLLDRYSTRR